MSGWLAYHAVLVTSICAALYRHRTGPRRLARDRPTLALMCIAINDGFAVLRKRGVRGAPRNLSLLHSRLLRAVAIQYWARSMRSAMGEIAFGAPARNAEREMRTLARDVLDDLVLDGEPVSLARLLAAPAAVDFGAS